jgi:hypothetical protein
MNKLAGYLSRQLKIVPNSFLCFLHRKLQVSKTSSDPKKHSTMSSGVQVILRPWIFHGRTSARWNIPQFSDTVHRTEVDKETDTEGKIYRERHAERQAERDRQRDRVIQNDREEQRDRKMKRENQTDRHKPTEKQTDRQRDTDG